MIIILGPHNPIDRLLLDAVLKGDLEGVPAMVGRGANLNILTGTSEEKPAYSTGPFENQTLLDICVVQHNVSMAKLLLKLGINTDIQGVPADQVFQKAAKKVTEMLGMTFMPDEEDPASPARPALIDTKKRSPLRGAIKTNDIPMIQALLEGGVNPNMPSGDGCYPLHDVVWYCKGDSALEAARLLLIHGADENAKNNSGQTAFEAVSSVLDKSPLWSGARVETAVAVSPILKSLEDRATLRQAMGIEPVRISPEKTQSQADQPAMTPAETKTPRAPRTM